MFSWCCACSQLIVARFPAGVWCRSFFSCCAVCVNTWPFTLELDGEELSDHNDGLWCLPVFRTVGTKECLGCPQFGAAGRSGASRTRRSGSREMVSDDRRTSQLMWAHEPLACPCSSDYYSLLTSLRWPVRVDDVSPPFLFLVLA